MGVCTTSKGALREDTGERKREGKKEKKRRLYGLYFQRDAGAVTATVGDETVREARRDARGPRVCTRDMDPPPTRRKSRIVILGGKESNRDPRIFFTNGLFCLCPGLRLLCSTLYSFLLRALIHLPLYILQSCTFAFVGLARLFVRLQTASRIEFTARSYTEKTTRR